MKPVFNPGFHVLNGPSIADPVEVSAGFTLLEEADSSVVFATEYDSDRDRPSVIGLVVEDRVETHSLLYTEGGCLPPSLVRLQ